MGEGSALGLVKGGAAPHLEATALPHVELVAPVEHVVEALDAAHEVHLKDSLGVEELGRVHRVGGAFAPVAHEPAADFAIQVALAGEEDNVPREERGYLGGLGGHFYVCLLTTFQF